MYLEQLESNQYINIDSIQDFGIAHPMSIDQLNRLIVDSDREFDKPTIFFGVRERGGAVV